MQQVQSQPAAPQPGEFLTLSKGLFQPWGMKMAPTKEMMRAMHAA